MGSRAAEVKALLGVAAAAALAVHAAPDAWACGEMLRGTTDRIANARYEIVFAAVPAPIEPGKHFSLDIAVCPRGGALPALSLRVDAVMPEHRHGMNYRPVVVAQGGGVYRADGLMFHMPGRWDLLFDLATSAGTERLAATRHLE
jgi:hypothetical protein